MDTIADSMPQLINTLDAPNSSGSIATSDTAAASSIAPGAPAEIKRTFHKKNIFGSDLVITFDRLSGYITKKPDFDFVSGSSHPAWGFYTMTSKARCLAFPGIFAATIVKIWDSIGGVKIHGTGRMALVALFEMGSGDAYAHYINYGAKYNVLIAEYQDIAEAETIKNVDVYATDVIAIDSTNYPIWSEILPRAHAMQHIARY
jgi:hypothetical protein